MSRSIVLAAALLVVGAGAATAHHAPPKFRDPALAQTRLYAAAVDHGLAVGRDEARSGSPGRVRAQAAKLWARLHPGAERAHRARERARRDPYGFPGPHDAHLARIMRCESRGVAGAVSRDGLYLGLFQFDWQTWRSVGGRGSPAAASVAEQWRRARMLYARRGSAPWPICQFR